MTPRFLAAAAAACASLLPTLSHADDSQPVTRAQVRHELIVLERYGYQPNSDDYPATLEQARSAMAREQSRNDKSASPAAKPG